MLKDDYKKEEKIDNIVYDMSPSADYRHGIANGNIYRCLGNALKDSPCLLFMGNLDYIYQADISDDYVIPDVIAVCDRFRLKSGSYTGTPKFVVETLSPGTVMRDKTIKKDIYEKCGVDEYWIVSPRERAIDIYHLEDKKYILAASYILEDNPGSKDYNANILISLKAFPNTQLSLTEIFKGIDDL